MTKQKELNTSILSEGVIDEKEVKQLREVLYADGIIDTEKSEFLFELTVAIPPWKNNVSCRPLLVEAITKFLIEDEKSPSVIDEDETKWLFKKIQRAGRVDVIEVALFKNLRGKSKDILQFVLNLY